MNTRFVRSAKQVIRMAGGLLLLVGCQTAYEPGGTPGIMASVQVAATDPEVIFAAVEQVFVSAGFKLVNVQSNTRVFERPGTQTDAVKYGDWDGSGVMMRAKVSAESRGGSVALECRVVAVRNYRQTLESENPVWRGYRKEYQALMEQVRQRLAVH
jgi:hypothetical protein